MVLTDTLINKEELLIEASRLETFGNKWVYGEDKVCSAANLAAAGFYYTGTREEPDSVTCFLCDKDLEGWEESDDPWNEHQKHQNNCYFVEIGKAEGDLTVEEFVNIWSKLRLINIRKLRVNLEQARAEAVKENAAVTKILMRALA